VNTYKWQPNALSTVAARAVLVSFVRPDSFRQHGLAGQEWTPEVDIGRSGLSSQGMGTVRLCQEVPSKADPGANQREIRGE